MLSFWQRAAIAVVITFAIIGVLVSDRWILNAAEGELSSIQKWFGESARTEVVERATGWYTAAIVDTGFADEVWKGYTRTPEQRARSPEFETGPFKAGLDWFETRIRVFFTLIFQVFLRLSAVVLWAPYLALLIAPAAIDGWVRRKIKQTSFSYTSPLAHSYSILAIKAAVVGILFVFLLPVPLPIGCIPAAGALIALALGLVIANTQKRI